MDDVDPSHRDLQYDEYRDEMSDEELERKFDDYNDEDENSPTEDN